MEIPRYEPFYLDSLHALRGEIDRLGLANIPLESDHSALASSICLSRGGRSIPNRFCAQPLTGQDAHPETGSPGDLTLRRYRRYAAGGFGLIWVESTLCGAPTAPVGRLRLHDGNVNAFRALVDAVRAESPRAVLILQLANVPVHSPALMADEGIICVREALVRTADLAAEAGFDGVDIQACHGSLASALLAARDRSGSFGGPFENRARFLRETLAPIRARQPRLLLATRLCAYDATRGGFGVSSRSYRTPDLDEPVRLAQLLREEAGIDLLNVTAASPNLTGAESERPFRPRRDGDKPDEHPLTTLDRQMCLARVLRGAVPGLPVVGSGLSWVRHFLPEVAAGAIAAGSFDVAGLGRSALACPDLPAQVLETGGVRPGSVCMVCFACNDLREDGAYPVGCVIRDAGVYGASHQQSRRFAPERLAVEAGRCHFCEAAPCVAACPTGVDIPAFIRAFLDGDEALAWRIIRARDVLPELTSRLSPGWLYREGACIETALTGKPVPIADLQYAVSWRARERGETGVRLPAKFTGQRVAVAGGGPAGLAASIRLLEQGCEVDLFERSHSLGGTPERMIPSSRFTGAQGEIDAVLAPAVEAGRLRVHLGCSLGERVRLAELRSGFDAVLLAAGFWRETSLFPEGQAVPAGVLDALTFLERAKRGEIARVPDRVAILSGGDCAMDAARTAKEMGAREVFVVFGGPRASMHWHMPEDWFAAPGVHALMHCRPLGYETGPEGRLTGVRVFHREIGQEGVLSAGLAVEAMGLQIDPSLRASLEEIGVKFTGDGRIELREPGSFQTQADRVYAAGALINGGDTVARCVAEGMRAAESIGRDLRDFVCSV